jgi:hypothetical protein
MSLSNSREQLPLKIKIWRKVNTYKEHGMSATPVKNEVIA